VESRREPTLIGTANIDEGGSKPRRCWNARMQGEGPKLDWPQNALDWR